MASLFKQLTNIIKLRLAVRHYLKGAKMVARELVTAAKQRSLQYLQQLVFPNIGGEALTKPIVQQLIKLPALRNLWLPNDTPVKLTELVPWEIRSRHHPNSFKPVRSFLPPADRHDTGDDSEIDWLAADLESSDSEDED